MGDLVSFAGKKTQWLNLMPSFHVLWKNNAMGFIISCQSGFSARGGNQWLTFMCCVNQRNGFHGSVRTRPQHWGNFGVWRLASLHDFPCSAGGGGSNNGDPLLQQKRQLSTLEESARQCLRHSGEAGECHFFCSFECFITGSEGHGDRSTEPFEGHIIMLCQRQQQKTNRIWLQLLFFKFLFSFLNVLFSNQNFGYLLPCICSSKL